MNLYSMSTPKGKNVYHDGGGRKKKAEVVM